MPRGAFFFITSPPFPPSSPSSGRSGELVVGSGLPSIRRSPCPPPPSLFPLAPGEGEGGRGREPRRERDVGCMVIESVSIGLQRGLREADESRSGTGGFGKGRNTSTARLSCTHLLPPASPCCRGKSFLWRRLYQLTDWVHLTAMSPLEAGLPCRRARPREEARAGRGYCACICTCEPPPPPCSSPPCYQQKSIIGIICVIMHLKKSIFF